MDPRPPRRRGMVYAPTACMCGKSFGEGGDADKCLPGRRPGPMRTCCLATQAAMQRQVHDKRRALMESDHQRALKQLPRDQKLARERSLKAYKRVRELRAQVCPRQLTCREFVAGWVHDATVTSSGQDLRAAHKRERDATGLLPLSRERRALKRTHAEKYGAVKTGLSRFAFPFIHWRDWDGDWVHASDVPAWARIQGADRAGTDGCRVCGAGGGARGEGAAGPPREPKRRGAS
jgi:hypothetical protein